MAVSADTLEGRLLAQRKILARILVALGDEGLVRFVGERDHFGGHEEDPGADPDPSFAIEAALAEEMRAIAAEIERLRRG